MIDTGRLRAAIADGLAGVRAIRHDLHAHPELGYQERRTAGVVRRELDRLGIPYVAGLAGGTGIVAHLPASSSAGSKPASATEGQAVGLRADMDALPIAEQTGLPYASTTPGVMHACGHDGHTAMLLGTAEVLARWPDRPHPVTLLFQPAEEGGGGADRLCREGALDGRLLGPPITRMFGLHGWPELPVGTVGTRPGPLLAATDELRVTIHGRQSHGAYPHYSRDPIVATSACITALQTIASRSVGPLDAVVVTIGIVQGGSATNIIPEQAMFAGTVRTLRAPVRDAVKNRILELLEHTARGYGCRAEVEWVDGYPVTNNEPALTEWWFNLARRALGEDQVRTIAEPTMGGEDFAFYGRHCPAVFFCLGVSTPGATRSPTLHQPDFDFNDQAIPTGVEMLCRVALEG